MAFLLAAPALAHARTILLDAEHHADRVAAIDPAAPRQSWAMHEAAPGAFTNTALTLTPGRVFLFRFNLAGLPEGQRIAHAELILPVTAYAGNEPRFYLWRTLAAWGPGVCYDYRLVADEPLPWTKPGARGLSTDRATRPTDIVRLTETGEITINVTEDVALWYSGAAPNEGWMLTVEDPGLSVQMRSPVWDGGNQWQLRLTYEPQ